MSRVYAYCGAQRRGGGLVVMAPLFVARGERPSAIRHATGPREGPFVTQLFGNRKLYNYSYIPGKGICVST